MVLEVAQLAVRHAPRRVRADGFVDVLNRDRMALERAWRDRAAVQDDARQVHPRQRHHRAGDRLVAAAQQDDRVEVMALHDQLDRIRDHLAAHERRPHALGAHRDAVGYGHRVELHRRAAGLPHRVLHMRGEPPQVEVARADLGPRVRDADERLVQIGLREADRLEHGAGPGTARAFGDRGAAVLERQVAHAAPPASAATGRDSAPGYDPSVFTAGANSARCMSARLQRAFMMTGRNVEIEHVLPRASGNRPRFHLGDVDVAQREDAQRAKQRARRVRQREDHRRLVERPRALDARDRGFARDDEKPRHVVGVVLDPGLQHAQTEDFGGALRGDRRGRRELPLLDQFGAARRVVGGHHLDAPQGPQEPVALSEGLRMRIDLPELIDRGAGQGNEAVMHRQLDLARDLELVLHQQVVVAVNRPADGVLDRQHAAGRALLFDREKDVLERRAGHERRGRVELRRRGLAVRARLSLVGNLHGRLVRPGGVESPAPDS